MNIPFIDIKKQHLFVKTVIDKNIQNVLSHGQYIMGKEVKQLEDKLAKFIQSEHSLSCANGTDALLLALMAFDIGLGDAVFCPSFTFCASAEVIANVGATPIFVDIDRNTYNICPKSLERAIDETHKSKELKPKAVIAVDLFGQLADYPIIADICHINNLKLISDNAQSFGATLKGLNPGHWADITTTSFFPAKPLGCYGDGGAVFTNDPRLADIIDSLRIHGKGTDKYDNVRIGINSRLDTLQAAILLAKLTVFSDEIKMRNKIAYRYIHKLRNHVLRVPYIAEGNVSTWAQFTIEVPNPTKLANLLQENSIPTARYYPKPLHMQTAYSNFPVEKSGLTNTLNCINKIISLPMHAYLDNNTQDYIIEAVISAL